MFDLLSGVGVPAMIGTQEIMIIAGVAVLLFGGSKIPELMRGMGQGIKEFKSAANEAADASQAANAPAHSPQNVGAITAPREIKEAIQPAA